MDWLTGLVHILRNAVAALPLFSRKRKGATMTRRRVQAAEKEDDDDDNVRVRYAFMLMMMMVQYGGVPKSREIVGKGKKRSKIETRGKATWIHT